MVVRQADERPNGSRGRQRRCLLVSLFVAALAVTPLFRERAAADETVLLPPELRREQVWQTGSSCGPNALYFFLRLHGKNVEHRELMQFLSPPAEGNSLEELRQASARYGLEAKVIKTTRSGIAQVDHPFIAHLNLPPDNRGHYVLVLRSNEHDFVAIDGTNARVVRIHPERFFRHWSGHLLVSGTGLLRRGLTVLVWTELVVLIALAGWLVARKFPALRRFRLRGPAAGSP